MMSFKLKITLVILLLGAILIIFAVWYKYEYSMDPVETVQFNSSDLDLKLLIATQGSTFKNKITSNITDYYKNDSIYEDMALLTKSSNSNKENNEEWLCKGANDVVFNSSILDKEVDNADFYD